MKKITLLISSLAGGGAEGVCVNVANGLAETGWQVNLVILNANNAVYLDRLSSKVKLVNLQIERALYSFQPLRKYLVSEKVNQILVFDYPLAVILVLLKKTIRHDIKIIARNINTLSKKISTTKSFWQRQVVFRLINRLYRKVDHVINQCHAMESDLLQLYPCLKGKTSVIYNPVNKSIEDALKPQDLNSIVKEDYILCVGRLEPQKAFHFAIQAFATIVEAHPTLRLKIVGQGSLKNELKQLAVDLNVSECVDFEGFQTDIVPYYLKARATVLTSLYEGFPNVLVESITLGTPVVSFNCPSGPSEIISHKNGTLVEYKNINSLASTLVKVLLKAWDPVLVSQSLQHLSTSNIISQYALLLSVSDT